MREDELDDTIRELARRTYHAPPEPPRDEIWERIRAERAARRGARPGEALEATTASEATSPLPGFAPLSSSPASGELSADGSRPDVVDLAARRRLVTRWTVRALPIAALLVLSFGLGRLTRFWDGTTQPVATTRPPARAPVQPGPAEPTPGAPAPAPEALAAAPPASGGADAAAAPSSPRLLADRTGRGTPAGRAGARTTLYRLAAQQTLGQAEMLLTSFRAEARAGGAIDPQVTSWAGDVLSSTRLLLDSPAARDPRLRGLLEDLELVLAQIVQVGAAPADSRSGDTDLIDHALQQRDLMLRLRTAVPAGATVGT